jgi:hypothetical protein
MSNTWGVINTLSVVVIATTVFTMVAMFFNEVKHLTPVDHVVLHAIFALTVYALAVKGSWSLKDDANSCAAFKAVLFWIVLMAKGGTITSAQGEYGAGPMHSTMITLSSVLFLFGLMYLAHLYKKNNFSDPTWYDEAETGIAGGAFGGGIAFLATIWIDEHFPHGGHEGDRLAHYENLIMKDIWAIITVVLAIYVAPRIGDMEKEAKKNEDQYWYARFLNFLGGAVGILPYFAVSFGGGEVVCKMLGFHPDSNGAALTGTAVMTAWSFTMILLCAFVPHLKADIESGEMSMANLMLGFGGFLGGYGWGSLICACILHLNTGWGWSETKQNMYTVGCLAVLNALAIPTYNNFLSPKVNG